MTRLFGAVPLWAYPLHMLVLGAVTALGLPPGSFWYLSVGALLVVFAIMPRAASPRQAGLWMWLFGTAYFIVALRWIVEPFQVEAELFGWMAPFALALMAAGLALFWGAAGWMAGRLGGVFALALAWSVAELARAYVLTGFPWAGFAQIWIDTPLAASLAKIGPHGLGLLTLLLPAALVSAGISVLQRVGCIGGLLAILAVLTFRMASIPPYEPEDRPVIRIVQPNAPQRDKWDPEKWAMFFWRQVDATRADPPPDLVVWPETAIPQLLEHAEEALGIVTEAARGVPVVLGLQRREAERYFNSLITLDGEGQVGDVYDKHHLVPFGEYMPLPGLFRNLGIRGLAQRADAGYAAGTGPRVIEVAGLRALPLICYEAVFPNHARASGERPDLLLQITNDAWFGDYAGPQQHLAQARMRAIEQGLPLVRAANTGISALIDPGGRIVAQMPLGTDGFVDVTLPKALPETLYARTGDGPIALLLLIGLAAFAMQRFQRIHD